MKLLKRMTLVVLLLTIFLPMAAQTVGTLVRIELKSGEVVTGTLIFQDENAVVVRNTEGARFQYQLAEIRSIADTHNVVEKPKPAQNQPANTSVGLMVQLASGVCHTTQGSNVFLDADLFVGHQNVLKKNIFVGGGLGYHTVFTPQGTWGFLPLMAHIEGSFMPAQRHSPYAGLQAGYAFAVGNDGDKNNSEIKGGLLADLSFGWKFRFNGRSALSLGLFGKAQQYASQLSETIDGNSYSYFGYRTMIGGGLRIGFHF